MPEVQPNSAQAQPSPPLSRPYAALPRSWRLLVYANIAYFVGLLVLLLAEMTTMTSDEQQHRHHHHHAGHHRGHHSAHHHQVFEHTFLPSAFVLVASLHAIGFFVTASPSYTYGLLMVYTSINTAIAAFVMYAAVGPSLTRVLAHGTSHGLAHMPSLLLWSQFLLHTGGSLSHFVTLLICRSTLAKLDRPQRSSEASTDASKKDD